MAKGFKIWKTVMFVTVMCMLLALGGGLLACQPAEEEHTHNWSQTYSFDDENHWLECTECHQHTGTEPHEFDDENDVSCNVCDYVRHVHTLVWKNDGDINGKHWQEYSCEHHDTEKFNEEDHVWGDDNLCDKCGLDRTPDHVHHEIVRYDETQHWTTYDCTEHGNEKINPQSHTFTNGSKCDGCDYDRDAEHQHTLSGWIHNNDPQYHWKEYTCWHHDDEQVEKAAHDFGNDDTCDTCGYVRAHDHNNYLIWHFDATQHWQTSTCHPDTAGEKNRAEHEFKSGVCACGLSESYIKVYNVYKAFEQAKGESEISEFTEWYNSLKEQNVHHVGIDANGDAVYYSSAQDTTGEVKYYGERTVTVSTSGIADVWVIAKVTVGSTEPKLLDLKQSTADGVTLKFIPVYKDNATYTVAIATEEELEANEKLPPIPLPANHLVTDQKTSYNIDAFTNKNITDIEFTIQKALGLGVAGSVTGVKLDSYMDMNYKERYFANPAGWEEGLYRLEVTTEEEVTNFEALYFSLNLDTNKQGSHFTDAGKSKCFIVFNLTHNDTKFYIRWNNSEAITISMTLTHIKQGDLKVENNKIGSLMVNQPESEVQTSYDISSLTEGKYVLTCLQSDGYVSYSIDGADQVVMSGTSVVEIAEGASQLTLTQSHWRNDVHGDRILIDNIKLCFTKLNTYTTDQEYTLKADQDGFIVESDSNRGHYYVAWAPEAEGAYKITLSGATEFSNLTVKLIGIETGSSNTLMTETGTATTSHSVSFIAKAQVKYYLDISTNDRNNSQYPKELTLKIEQTEASAFEVDTPATVTFSAESTKVAYVGQLNAGAYLLYLAGENLENVSLVLDVNGKKTTVNQNNRFKDVIVSADTSAMLNVEFTGSDSYPTISFLIIDLNNGADIESTSFTAELTADKYFKTYAFTEEEANYYMLTLESLKDLKNVYVYCATHTSSSSQVTQWLGAEEETTMKREFFAPGASVSSRGEYTATVAGSKYVIAIIADKGDTDYPENVTIKFQKSLYSSGFYAIYANVPYVGFDAEAGKHATSYELYLATLAVAGTPEEQDYKLVKTFIADNLDEDGLSYLETDKAKFGNYFYWKVVLKDSTGTYLQYEMTNVRSANSSLYHQGVKYNADGLTTKVTVTVPEDFEGKITANIYNTNSYTTSTLFGRGVATVTKGSTQVVIDIYSPAIANKSMTGYIKLEIAEDIRNKYTLPDTRQTTFGSENVHLDIINKVAITATITLPDNFVEKEGEPLTVTLYRGETVGNSYKQMEAQAVIDEGGKTATVTLYGYKEYDSFIVAITGGLGEGYEASAEKYSVQLAPDGNTGTVALTVNQRTKVDVELTLPAHFVGGQVTLKFYLIKDGVASSTSVDKSMTIPANDTDATVKQTISIYLPMNKHYKVVLIAPANSGYAAEDIDDLDLNNTTVKAEMTVLDRVAITANVELPGDSTATSVTVNLYDKTIGQVVSSGTVEVSADESSGKKKGSAVLYGPEGHEFVLRAEDTSALTDRSDFDTDEAEVTVDGKTGSGTIEGYLKYSVKVNIGFIDEEAARMWGTTNVLSQKVYLYKGNTQLTYITSGNIIGTENTEKHWEVTLYLSNKRFESGADYYVAVSRYDINRSKSSLNFICPSVKIEWSDEQKQVNLDAKVYYKLTTSNLKDVEVTINVPEEYTNTANHIIRVLEVYGLWDQVPGTYNLNGDQFLIVPFSGVEQHKITATYSKYPECKYLYFNLTGGDLMDIMDYYTTFAKANAINKGWYAVAGPVTYGEDGKGKVEITIKKATPVKLKMPELGFEDVDTPEFTVNIDLKDQKGNPAGKYTYKVDANAKADSVNKTLYILADNIEGYTADVSITPSGKLGCAYSLSDTKAYEFKVESGEQNVLQVNLVKNTKIKVTVPNLDYSNEVTTPAFDIALKVKNGSSEVGSYTISVPANATAEFEQYIFIPVWEDGYTIEVSTSATECAYKVESATHELLETEHNIKINVTKKPIAKVTVKGLVEGTQNTAFTLKLTVKDAANHNVSVETSFSVAAQTTNDALLGYIYMDSWAEGYQVAFSANCKEYIVKSAEFDADADSLHTLVVTLVEKAKISIVTDGLVGDEVKTQAFSFSITVRDKNGNAILSSQSVSIPKNATDESFGSQMAYLNSVWEEGFTIEPNLTDSNRNDYDIQNCEFSDGEDGVHKLTVHFVEQTRVKVKVPDLLTDMTTGEFNISITVKDINAREKGKITVTVPAKSGSDFEYLTHFRTFEGMEEGVQFTVSGTAGNYTLKRCSYDNSEGIYTVTVVVEAKLSVKIVVKGLDADLNAPAFKLKCDIRNGNMSQQYYEAQIPAGAASYEQLWVPTALYAGWQANFTPQVTVTGSPAAATVPYLFSAVFESEVVSNQHVMTITATPKQHVKVVINGLDGTNEKFTLSVNIVKSQGGASASNQTFVINANSTEFEKMYFLSSTEWGETYQLSDKPQSSNVPYKIAESSFTLENGKAYLHVLTITLAKREKLTVSFNFPADFAASENRYFMFNITDSTGEKTFISNVSILISKGSTEIAPKEYYIDDKLEAGSQVKFTASGAIGGTVEGYNVTHELNIENSTLTITVTAAAAAAA